MFDKRQLSYNIKKVQKIRVWQLMILLILSVFLTATFLRLNNLGMVERREAVLAADKEGGAEDIQNALYDLQRFVTGHMNTDMGNGLYLVESRQRDVNEAYEKAANDESEYGNIYKKAQEVCAPKFSYYSYAYQECTMNELEKYPSGNDLISEIELLPIDAYRHDFVSPMWSPDFAGFSLLISLIILIMIVVRLTGVVILRMLLKRHHKSV